MDALPTQQIETEVADGTKMILHWAGPKDQAPAPGIIVLQEAFGVNSHIRDVVGRFAAEGYWAVAPELYHRTAKNFEGSYTDFAALGPHMQAVNTSTLQADLQATAQWMRRQPKIMVDKIASIGFCLGGRATFVANATLPLSAAISFYGGGIAPDLLPIAEKQHGPIALIWGGLDKHIPCDKTRAVADALTKARKTFIHVEFADADHGFFCDERQQYNPNAAAEAWALCKVFLANRLRK